MIFVDLDAFLKLPAGTVYSKYTPCACDEISIKQSNIGDYDWIYIPLDTISFIKSEGSDDLFEILMNMKEGDSIKTDMLASMRDGLFDKDAKFLIYSKNDIEKLIALLGYALKLQDVKIMS